MNLTKRKRQALTLLADADQLVTIAELQEAADRRWGRASWRFGRSLRELVAVYYVARVGERYRITDMGKRKLGRDPDDA